MGRCGPRTRENNNKRCQLQYFDGAPHTRRPAKKSTSQMKTSELIIHPFASRRLHITINHRYDTMWKLWLISGFCLTFDVPCLRKLHLVYSRWEVRKNVFNLALSRHKNVEWKQAEVKTTSHSGIKNCERCQVEDVIALPCESRLDFYLQETGGIDFLQLPDPHSVSTRQFSQFLMLDWTHFSSRAQWSTWSLTHNPGKEMTGTSGCITHSRRQD